MNFEIDFYKHMHFNDDEKKKPKQIYWMVWTYFLILCKSKSDLSWNVLGFFLNLTHSLSLSLICLDVIYGMVRTVSLSLSLIFFFIKTHL